MSKKFFIITGTILIIILAALVGYYFFFQQNSDGTVGNIAKFKNFFPFGGNDIATTTTPIVEEQITPQQSQQTNFTQKLRKLSTEPVAGAGIADYKAGSVVRHIEKATGHIYETELFSPIQNRISNTTIPMAYDAIWGNSSSLVARYLKDDNQTINTYSLSIKPATQTGSSQATTTESSVSGIQFPVNISDYSVLGTSVFYLEQSQNGSTGIISNIDGSKKKQIWNSPIKELLSQYVNSATVALTTKPYQNMTGFLYFVSTSNGQVKKILGNTAGLSTLANPDATKVLAISQTSSIYMFIYNISDKSSTAITPSTFPEKCVWSKKDKAVLYCAVPQEYLNGDSLTSWYMGYGTYTDDIWKYDLKNNTSSMI